MHEKILHWGDEKDIDLVASELKKGAVVIGSSDTVIGFLALANEQGMIALNQIKGRFEKPYIVLVGDKGRICDFAVPLAEPVKKLVDQCWPGPLTLILRAAPGTLPCLQAKGGTIAIRMPLLSGLLKLLTLVPAVFSTSANRAGASVPVDIAAIDQAILNEVAQVIVENVSEPICCVTKPSTIIDCTGPVLRVVREGAYSIDVLEDIVGQNFLRS